MQVKTNDVEASLHPFWRERSHTFLLKQIKSIMSPMINLSFISVIAVAIPRINTIEKSMACKAIKSCKSNHYGNSAVTKFGVKLHLFYSV